MEYLSEVVKTQCTARVVANSISSATGEEITTFELEYPRIIHAEFLTHRLFSRNAASSRAIPVAKLVEMVYEKPAMPVRFGANQSGMQDKGAEHLGFYEVSYDESEEILDGRGIWERASLDAGSWAEALNAAGYHKQICNRLIEPFQYIKVVLTFTGTGANFYGLRDHTDADPTICELAQAMKEAYNLAPAKVLRKGDWHLPYYKEGAFVKGRDRGLEKARRISASCCAQVSYRRLDASEEKADAVFARLVESKPVHASPTEHQATPLAKDVGFRSKYVTHVDRQGNAWSGNFRNWGQFRQIIDGNVIPDDLDM